MSDLLNSVPPPRLVVSVTPARQLVSLMVFFLGAVGAFFLAGQRHVVVALPLLVIFSTMNVALAPNRLTAARFALWASVVGLLIELLMAMFKITAFRLASAKYPLMPPVWMIGVWALFGSLMSTGLSVLRQRLLLAAACGAVFAPGFYWAAIELDAIGYGVPTGGAPSLLRSMICIAVVWAGVLPFLIVLSKRFESVHTWAE